MINLHSNTRKFFVVLIILALVFLVYLIFFYDNAEKEKDINENNQVNSASQGKVNIEEEAKKIQERKTQLANNYKQEVNRVIDKYQTENLSVSSIENLQTSLLELKVDEENMQFHRDLVFAMGNLVTALESENQLIVEESQEKLKDLIESKDWIE